MNKCRHTVAWTLLGLSVIVALATYDLAPVIKAVNQLDRVQPTAPYAKSVATELSTVTGCHRDFPETKVWRDCLNAQMPKLHHMIPLFMASALAESWLADHPGDTELQKSALVAMDQAWHSFYVEDKPRYDALDDVNYAANNSVLGRLVVRPSSSSVTEMWRNNLAKTELALGNPVLARTQMKRLLQLENAEFAKHKPK